MSGWAVLALMGALIGVVAIIVVAALRASGKAGAAEANAGHERRQKEAIIADQERANAKEDAANVARKVPVDGPDAAAAILRRAGRIRKP